MMLGSAYHKLLNSLAAQFIWLDRNRTLRAIHEGMVNLIPLILIGTICLALINLPIPLLQDVLEFITMGQWTFISNILSYSTADVIALAMLLSVSLALARESDLLNKREVNHFIPMFTAFACYVILMVWTPDNYAPVITDGQPLYKFTNPGRRGVFFGLFVAVAATELMIWYTKLWIKLPWIRRRVAGSNYQVRIATRAIAPILSTLLTFVAFRLFCDWFDASTVWNERVAEAITNIVTAGDLPNLLLAVLLMQFFWFFGIHGSNAVQTFMVAPEMHGLSVDPAGVFTNPSFYSIFVDIGGTGTGLALLLALICFGSKGKNRHLTRISIFPAIFNINETVIYGLPIVLNPFYLIPFLLTPMLSTAISYAAISSGLVPGINTAVLWTTPIFFSGYMATGSLAAPVLQLVCIAAGFLVYAPFVRISQKATNQALMKTYEVFKQVASAAANDEHVLLINQKDDVGDMARDFIAEINELADHRQEPFRMVFQPKTDSQGRVAGAESLLRWTHNQFGAIPPDVLIELTDEADLSVRLGRWITRRSLEMYAQVQEAGLYGIVLSINLNPLHIYQDDDFPEYLSAELQRLNIDPKLIEMEITEHVAVHSSEKLREKFKQLRRAGVGLSIDDMGMGYSSLNYISEYDVETVKIDISLIGNVDKSKREQEIVRSVISLARTLDLAVIIEGAERLEQIQMLSSLGCRYFQGFYFSKPLELADFIAFSHEHGLVHMEHEGAET